jgi:hypothetical protein
MTLPHLPAALATFAFATAVGAAGGAPARASDRRGATHDRLGLRGRRAVEGVLHGDRGRFDPSKPVDFETALGAISAGGHAGFIRTTTEVVRSDQHDTASAPGTCESGWQPQPDCMSDVVDLTK